MHSLQFTITILTKLVTIALKSGHIQLDLQLLVAIVSHQNRHSGY